jgi:hypothetical protein
MLFLQPVVVDDARLMDRSAPAEVRIAERAQAQPGWTGEALAQSSMDQRSPFGNNAPTSNDLTPDFVPLNRPGNQIGVDQPGGGPIRPPADSMSNTRIPPPSGRPDAGPPPPGGTTTVNPDRATDVAAPATATPGTTPTTATPGTTPTTATPGTTPSTSTPGAGAAPGTTIRMPNTTPAPPAGGSSTFGPPAGATMPGVSSGASNTR